MRCEPPSSQGILNDWLNELGFNLLMRENTDFIFLNKKEDICLIVDTVICSLTDYPYVTYTSRQNDLMANHSRVFRFLFDHTSSVQ
jgi:hypothetical protein